MKVKIFFDIVGAIGGMVLLIFLEQIELECCAWAQIKAPEELNR